MPYRKILKTIKEINNNKETLDHREIYFKISEEFRSYLTERTGKDFITITTKEVNFLLKKIFPKAKGFSNISKFLKYTDLIKFAGVKSPTSQVEKDMEKAFTLVTQLEDAFKEKRKNEKKEHSKGGRNVDI